MAVELIGQQGEALTGADTLAVQSLALELKEALERWCRAHGKPDSVALGCALGVLWGWQRRSALQEGALSLASRAAEVTTMLGNRAVEIWRACEAAEEKRRRGNALPTTGTG